MSNKKSNNKLITPYGEKLVNLIANEEEIADLKNLATELNSVQISERSMCDFEMMSTGAFSPLDRFMNQADYQSVVETQRLSNGTLFPIPITLPINSTDDVKLDSQIALRSPKNDLLAIMTVEEIYECDQKADAKKVFGTDDTKHPMIAEMETWGKYNISGKVQTIQTPSHSDFNPLRLTPGETRLRLEEFGYENVVAFQTRNPLHRVHEELTKRAAESVDGVLLIHPVVGMTKPGDVDHYTRVRTYKALTDNYYDQDKVLLSLLPLAMRMGGPREAIWHAIIRRNYGANHLIVGRDHAGPGVDSKGNPFYGPYDAQESVLEHQTELGVKMVPFQMVVYLPDEDRYEEISKVDDTMKTASISGTQVRDDYLSLGKSLPTWFTRPEVSQILEQSFPPMHQQGVCIWFTGLSGAGKTATADIVTNMILEKGRRSTVLDGDVVRTHLSKGLGFSAEDRDTNIRRIGFVAAEVVRHGGIAICAAVSPYIATRNEVREMVGSDKFIEVHVATPLEVAESRDVKGMYAKARRGEIKGFTGIDDPYEEPVNPEITLDTVKFSAEENANRIVTELEKRGFFKS
ncbi:MAG: bifunctional sulfate adenylyltransferase/adenylylsulfate kinase [SAR202 cluster bacterium]|nr:bifunctional sulfate adenylyltransferase/adenylylsulfate kinase [SAR202 cluster bacterium]